MEEIAVRRAWEKFVERGVQSPGLRDAVVTSWKRCQGHQVLTSSDCAPLISEGETYRHRSDNVWLAKCAALALEKCGSFLSNANSMMILTDSTGVIIDTKGDDRSIDAGKEIHLQRGGCWTESDIGTNAIGTALACAQPIQIHAAEHYCEKVQRWTCAAAPILHPIDRELLGVIDISGPASTFSKQSLAFAVAAADHIQAIMAKSIRLDHWKLVRHYRARRRNWSNEESIVVDHRGTIVCVTSNALKIANRQNKDAIGPLSIPSLRSTPFSRWEAKLRGLLPISRTELVTEGEDELGAIIIFAQRNCAHVAHTTTDRRDRGIDIDNFVESLFARDLSQEPLCLNSDSRVLHSVAADNHRGARAHARSSSRSTQSAPVLIAEDPNVRDIVEQVARAASRGMSILIGGETGTGKELLARRAHAESGRKAAFVPVNCAALPASLIEAELFGYADGAFTGARRGGSVGLAKQADGGTLFLDEIGDMPVELQAALLRLLDDWTVRPVGGTPTKIDVLLVSATNVDLNAAVAEGRLRRDLFYRLNMLQVTLPPLSHRTDFEALATYLLRTTLDETCDITPEALALLSQRSWPGNMRELKSVLARLSLNVSGGSIEASQVRRSSSAISAADQSSSLGTEGTLRDLKRARVLVAHAEANYNIAETARRLGVSRNTIYRLLGQHQKR